MNHPQHLVCMWLQQRTWSAEYPLCPYFWLETQPPTIPHLYSKRKDTGFPMGCADTAAVDGRRGSNVYEINPWLWHFWRGKPSLGGLSVEETQVRKQAARDERNLHAAETRRRSKTYRA